MATTKKTTATKSGPKAKATKKPEAKSVGTSGAVPKVAVRKTRTPAKSSTKLPASFTLEPKVPVVEPVIHHDDIALRAYFIAERRQQMGWAGDSASDWADAEAQLRAEVLEKPLKKR